MNEYLLTIINKLCITLAAKPLSSIPARESDARPWRVTLTRTSGRGQNAKKLKLSTVYIGGIEPPAAIYVVECLIHDTKAGEQSFWDFAHTWCEGQTSDPTTDTLYAQCKSVGRKVHRFFGDTWEAITRAERGLDPLMKPEKQGKPSKSAKKTG